MRPWLEGYIRAVQWADRGDRGPVVVGYVRRLVATADNYVYRSHAQRLLTEVTDHDEDVHDDQQ
jgi:hypothetical protein